MRLQMRLLLVAAVCLFAFGAVAQEADLIVSKSAPSTANAGDNVTFTIDVLNGGPDDASAVTLIDTFPSGTTYVSHTNDAAFSCSATATDLTCTAPTLAAFATASFTVTLTLPPDAPGGTTFLNSATATSQTFDPGDENNTAVAGVSTPPDPSPELGVMKSGPNSAGPDTDVSYTLTLSNFGDGDAIGVTLSDSVGGDMTFVSLIQNSGPTMDCTPLPSPGTSPISISCSADPFPAGATAVFTLVGHIPPGTPAGTEYTNTLSVTAEVPDPNPVNDTATVTTIVSSTDVAIVKSGPASVLGGDPIAYTITLTNNGPDTATDASWTDTLPPNTTFVSLMQVTGPSANCSTLPVGGTGSVGCSIGLLGSGQSASFTLTVEAGDTTSVSNTATASSSSFDPDNSNNSSNVVTTVTPNADLSIVKSGPASVVAGTNLQYTITVTNNGPTSASGVSVADTVPAGTTLVSATSTQGSCTGNPAVTCTIGTMAASAVVTITYTVHVDVNYAGPVSNTATVSSSTVDPDGSNNTSNTSATVTPAPVDLSITKTADHAAVLVGQNITYTITVSNAGPGTATNTTVTDTIPANTTYVSATSSQGSCSGNPTVTCTIGTLTPGASATITLVVTAPSTPQPVVNSATATSNEADANPVNNTGASTVNAVLPSASIPTLSPFALALLALALGVAMVLKAR